MGKRANFLDIIEMNDIFDKYLDKVNFEPIQNIADMMMINLRNRILEEKVDILETEVNFLRERMEFAEVEG